MINIVNVTHHYGIKPVLRNVSMQIVRGEVMALMGPNGSGKSTLLALMAGALAPLEGYVEIDGKRRRASEQDELAIRRQSVYLTAEPWLSQMASGREWLLAVGRLYELDHRRLMEHADRLLALFSLEKQADSRISACSTGQRKKIALAAALITEAPIMLLDEPFAGGLDPSGILALKRVLQQRAHGDDFTIVMATPVPELVEELADRVAIMRDGQIVACDTIEGLRRSTGITGGLDEIYESLANPAAATTIEGYLHAEQTR